MVNVGFAQREKQGLMGGESRRIEEWMGGIMKGCTYQG